MILPKHKLEELDYYTVTYDNLIDTITLHWKAWYKPKTVINFPRSITKARYDESIDDIISTYTEAPECCSLRNQLYNYFND